ncbi:hypothetical protein T06_11237 [Trichinella sp. T6]|nr:hypothetical protein T06_11237 [Trichinella sp. T6]
MQILKKRFSLIFAKKNQVHEAIETMKFCKFPENLIPPNMEFMGINRSETIRRVQQTYRGGFQLRIS